MSNRTSPTEQSRTLSDQVNARLLDAALAQLGDLRSQLTAAVAQVASLTTRLDTMDRDRSTLAATLAEHERRLGALAVPEQLEVLKRIKAALEENLQQTVTWLEWFTRQSTKVRNLVDGVRDDLSPTPSANDLADAAVPDIGKVLAALDGKGGSDDKVAGLLTALGIKV
jgi:chromosome segregation ATPase